MADPLSPYPFPSNVHVLSSVTLKLSDSNYLLWKTQFESLLSSQKLIGFVNGTVAAPPSTHTVVTGNVTTVEANPVFDSWFCTDQLVRSWLFGTLSEEVLGYVHNLSTSREIWLSLAENFNQSSLAREFSLRRNLQGLTKKGKTLMEYCRELKTICDSLASIGKPVDESMKIFGFLNGLGREYDPVTTGIQRDLSKQPPPTFHDVVTEVQAYDLKLKSYEADEATNTHLAFNTQRSDYNDGYKSGSPSYNPHQRGTRGRFGQNRGRGGYTSRGRGFSQHQTPQTGTGERPVCQICGRIGHTAVKCYNRFDNNYQGQAAAQAFSALQVSEVTGKEWYPDSGASAHITATKDNLQTSTPYEGNETIMVADGTYIPITHVGSANITSATESSSKGSSG
uniref:Retrovirus-related Pol polyprotein from transposon TNT 1-94-like beta-barrel domain-containing protein n=1 Tax=Noccaea caerulescens TaxID=107243 RepID=A0A1J3F4F3_NOCCA